MVPKQDFLVVALFLGFCLFVLPAHAFGQMNIGGDTLKFGKFTLSPTLSYSSEWNDNIFLDPDNETEDWVHTLNLSVNARFGLEPLRTRHLEFGFDTSYFSFGTGDGEDYNSFDLYGRFFKELNNRVSLRMNDAFRYTEDQYGSEEEFNLGEQTKRWNNTFSAGLEYRFYDRFRLAFSYGNFIERFRSDGDEWQDKTEHLPAVTWYYRFLPKTSVLLEYRVAFRMYPEQNDGFILNGNQIDSGNSQDYMDHHLLTGLHWDATAKLSGDLKIGLGYQDYENSRDWNGEEYEEDATWVADVLLAYALRPKTTLNFGLQRRQYASTYDQATQYTFSAVRLGLIQELGQLWRLNLSGEYADYEYEVYQGVRSRDDDRLQGQIRLSRPVWKFLQASLGYSYLNRNSDIAEYDYENNIVEFQVSARF